MGGAQSRKFDVSKMPDLTGRVFLITGCSVGGLGFQTAVELLLANATVVITTRNEAKGTESVATILQDCKDRISKQRHDALQLHSITLNLDHFASIRAAVEAFKALKMPLHVLVNNAGVMMCPEKKTAEGIEYQFGVNHVGHFLWTSLLFSMVAASSTAAQPSRIVTLTSSFHEKGPREGILFNDINWETTPYESGLAYGHSKYANLVFSFELNRRAAAAAKSSHPEGEAAAVVCNAVHPGFVDTQLTRFKQREFGMLGGAILAVYKTARGALSLDVGVLTQLYAAASPEASTGGKFFIPTAVESPPFADCPPITKEMSENLWTLSEKLAGGLFEVA